MYKTIEKIRQRGFITLIRHRRNTRSAVGEEKKEGTHGSRHSQSYIRLPKGNDTNNIIRARFRRQHFGAIACKQTQYPEASHGCPIIPVQREAQFGDLSFLNKEFRPHVLCKMYWKNK